MANVTSEMQLPPNSFNMSLISSDSMSLFLNDYPSIKLEGEQERQNHEMMVKLNDRLFDYMSKTSTITVEFKYEKKVIEKIVELTRSGSLNIAMESSMVKSLEQQISELKRRLEIEIKAKIDAESKIDKLQEEHLEEIKTLRAKIEFLEKSLYVVKTEQEVGMGIIVISDKKADDEFIIKAMIQRMRKSYTEDETDGLGCIYQLWTDFIGATEREMAKSLEIEELKAKIQEMTIFHQKQTDLFKKEIDWLNERVRNTIYLNYQTKRMQTEINVYKELLQIMEERLEQCGGSLPICGLPAHGGWFDGVRTKTWTVEYEEKKYEVERVVKSVQSSGHNKEETATLPVAQPGDTKQQPKAQAVQPGSKSDAPKGDEKKETTTPTKPPPGDTKQQPKAQAVQPGSKSDAPKGDEKKETTTPTKPPPGETKEQPQAQAVQPGESPQQAKIKKNKK